MKYHCRLFVVLYLLSIEVKYSLIVITALFVCMLQTPCLMGDYWELEPARGIRLSPDAFPCGHSDHIEMAGKKIAAILTWKFDANGQLEIERDLIFPQFRRYLLKSDPDWNSLRNYGREVFSDSSLPDIYVGNSRWTPGALKSVVIDGFLRFQHEVVDELELRRTLYPSMTDRFFAEKWEIINQGQTELSINIADTKVEKQYDGQEGSYSIGLKVEGAGMHMVKPGTSLRIVYVFYANKTGSDVEEKISNAEQAFEERSLFVEKMRKSLVLETPDAVLNTLFMMSKIRACESIYESKMGLVHSPGGGRYYVGIWANDQAEYMNPLFPYIGYADGNIAAMNAYNMFMSSIPENGDKIWASFEMQGDVPCCSKDRGDAAMILYGLSHYLLASGNGALANHFWPLLVWAIDYCESKKTDTGIIASDTDEMEGRVPTGDANLSTSSLYYGGLQLAGHLAVALHKEEESEKFNRLAEQMSQSIESQFGAIVDGLETYQYFKGHPYLRHWICLPLVMGIFDRKDGTLDALFDRLWSENGVRVQLTPEIEKSQLIWDRGTLYALRGCFFAGAADRAYMRLLEYSRKRLLGTHVPYVVEAYPEGDMSHLAAESGLYCRVFTEGVLGISPLGFDTFEIKPSLPSDWKFCNLRQIHAFGSVFSVEVKQVENGNHEVKVFMDGNERLSTILPQGGTTQVQL